jgi:hypothetical protein
MVPFDRVRRRVGGFLDMACRVFIFSVLVLVPTLCGGAMFTVPFITTPFRASRKQCREVSVLVICTSAGTTKQHYLFVWKKREKIQAILSDCHFHYCIRFWLKDHFGKKNQILHGNEHLSNFKMTSYV